MVKAKEAIQEPIAEELEEEEVQAPAPVAPPKPEETLGETPDSVELYLNEIARYKLLRPEEEVQLAKEIENGRILEEASDALLEETGVVPSIEQLTVRLLSDIRDGLSLVRRSKALKGFPVRGAYTDRVHHIVAAVDELADVLADRMQLQLLGTKAHQARREHALAPNQRQHALLARQRAGPQGLVADDGDRSQPLPQGVEVRVGLGRLEAGVREHADVRDTLLAEQ